MAIRDNKPFLFITYVYISIILTLACCYEGATPIFEDDFNNFDLSVWQHEITLGGGGNWEFEYYANNRSNSFVKDGILNILPTMTADTIGEDNLLNGYTMDLWGSQPADACTGNAFYGCSRTSGAGGNYLNPIQSARIRTTHSFSFQYGRLEVSAKLPVGDWLWPAIWLLPKYQSYGPWPASGEIDIVESRGNGPSYPAGGVNTFGSTLHWGPFASLDPFQLTHAEYKLNNGTLNDEFHTYGLYWDSTQLYTYIDTDSNRVLEVAMNETFFKKGGWESSTFNNPWAAGNIDAPFDQEFYIIFNVACGGTSNYFPDGVAGKPWTNNSPHAVNEFWNAKAQWLPSWTSPAMQIDWIRVYPLADS